MFANKQRGFKVVEIRMKFGWDVPSTFIALIALITGKKNGFVGQNSH